MSVTGLNSILHVCTAGKPKYQMVVLPDSAGPQTDFFFPHLSCYSSIDQVRRLLLKDLV